MRDDGGGWCCVTNDAMKTILAKLRALFRRKNLEAEMAEEMRQHLERRTQEKVADGMAPGEAHFAAQREFGGLEQIKAAVRDERTFLWVERRGDSCLDWRPRTR